MDQRLAIILNVENSRRIKKWLETLPPIHYTTRKGTVTSPDLARADLMDRCHHPDCAFQVRLMSVHNHIHYQGLPLEELYPVYWSETSGNTDTDTTFWTAQSHHNGTESSEEEERGSKEDEDEEEEEEGPRETPPPRHAPFNMNLYQASWFHKLDLSEDACSISKEDRDFLVNKPLEASTRKQISRHFRKLREFRPRYPTKSQRIAPKLRQWKQAVVARLGGNGPGV